MSDANFDFNNASIERETAAILRYLEDFKEEIRRKKNKPLRAAGKLLEEAAKARINDSKEPHHVYDTPKLVGKKRAPKGQGRIVETIYPGTLRKNIVTRYSRKLKGILTGPSFQKKRGKNPLVFYAHMVHDGTEHIAPNPYMTAAFRAKKTEMLRIIRDGYRKIADSITKKNAR